MKKLTNKYITNPNNIFPEKETKSIINDIKAQMTNSHTFGRVNSGKCIFN